MAIMQKKSAQISIFEDLQKVTINFNLSIVNMNKPVFILCITF